nr:MAG TPA: hypothetical protein [Caudoviricetes sp.]
MFCEIVAVTIVPNKTDKNTVISSFRIPGNGP